jgi:hypothetical protein
VVLKAFEHTDSHFMDITSLNQVSQSTARASKMDKKFWNELIKNYCILVPFNGITSIPNFIKIYQMVENLFGAGVHR